MNLLDSLAPLAAFMFAASITPGPNNLMVASAGARAGYRATLPHLLGIGIGHSFQVGLCSLGLGALLLAQPELVVLAKALATAFLLWMAWGIAGSPPPAGEAPGVARGPLGFLPAAAFQWINPKAWAMALTTSGALLPDWPDRAAAVAAACLVVVLVNFPCVSAWAAFGATLRRRLRRAIHWRIFNLVMAAALALTAVWILRS